MRPLIFTVSSAFAVFATIAQSGLELAWSATMFFPAGATRTVNLTAGANIQAAIDANPAGTTFQLSLGSTAASNSNRPTATSSSAIRAAAPS